MRATKYAVILALTSMLGGCIPFYGGYEENMYAPGGQLADKHEGPVILASATDASLAAMFPMGTQKAVVLQALGAPAAASSSTDGKSTTLFTHTFTSYARKVVEFESLNVEYDKKGGVTNMTFTKSRNTW